MTATPASDDIPHYERSARTDYRIWLLFLVGMAFAVTGSLVDPAQNCNDSGECAPWLVPVAKWMGVIFALGAGGQLLGNPRRGSRLDPETGDLVWWQNRFGVTGNNEGRIHPGKIGRILIAQRDEQDDLVRLYDRDGKAQAFFDNEVIPWPYETWAARLQRRWPHIVVEKKD